MSRRLAMPALVLLLLAGTADAHDRGTSYSTWTVRGREAHIVIRLTELEVSRFPWGTSPNRNRTLASYLPNHLQLLTDGRPCTVVDGPRSLQAPAGHLAFEWSLSCPGDGAVHLHSTLMREVSPAHLHFARARLNGAAPVERVLSERDDVWLLTAPETAGSPRTARGTGVLDYLRLGVDHILTGYDHLAFLLALVLVGGSLVDVAKMVTGFTVAHSFTLGLMVLGYLQPDTTSVESLIGLSIALVAAENLWLAGRRPRALPWAAALLLSTLTVLAASGYGRVPAVTLLGLTVFTLCYFELLGRTARPASVRWCVAFVFGLVHGFGFAGMLGEAGVPQDRVVAALFGFNTGVELGQLAAVCTVWPLLRLATAADRPRLRAVVIEGGSAAVFAMGTFWFVARAYG